ncbi:MAG: hypothetical protein E6Q33_00795 [Neisseriales bacterium]|nr:MAG: hypothetical protein E6Q33_00795 [Neisseriales bacterium]
MKKLALLILVAGTSYADNQNYFDNAYQIGKQNQYNLNLNQNSTFNSYTQANNIESNISKNATTGTIGAETVYKNADKDVNYLYNQGKQEISNCQSKSDPRCTSLNKYGDKDTLTQMQAYSQGITEKYYIGVRPDPSDTQCSYVTRKVPVNATTATCIATSHNQNTCNSIINLSVNSYQCYTANNGCRTYQNNSDCKLIQAEVPWKCTYHYSVDMCAGGNYSGDWSCVTTPTSTPPAITKPDGYTGGVCGGGNQQIPGWGGCPWGSARETSKSCTQTKPAVYSCKSYSYSDGCVGFKQ